MESSHKKTEREDFKKVEEIAKKTNDQELLEDAKKRMGNNKNVEKWPK